MRSQHDGGRVVDNNASGRFVAELLIVLKAQRFEECDGPRQVNYRKREENLVDHAHLF